MLIVDLLHFLVQQVIHTLLKVVVIVVEEHWRPSGDDGDEDTLV